MMWAYIYLFGSYFLMKHSIESGDRTTLAIINHSPYFVLALGLLCSPLIAIVHILNGGKK